MLDTLERVCDRLPEHVRAVVARQTPIVSFAAKAAAAQREHPQLVRADIGQIVGVDPETEVLYGPPVGLQALRELVAELYNLSYGLRDPSGVSSSALTGRNVAICSGAAEALSLLFRCFGADKVVGLPRLHWENYRNAVDLAGGRVVLLDYFDARGALDIDGLRIQLVESKAACFVANFPCNPTGAVLSASEAQAVAELARELDVVLIADEVYGRLRYDGQLAHSMLAFGPDHVVSVGSASKEFLLPGTRVGYVVSAHEALPDVVLRKLIRANTASPNVLGQRGLAALIEQDLVSLRVGEEAPRLEAIRRAMKERRDGLLEVLAAHGMSLLGRPGRQPEGAIFVMARLPSWWSADAPAFIEDALERGGFSAVPGTAFGAPEAIRLSYGAMDLDAVARLGACLSAMQRAASA